MKFESQISILENSLGREKKLRKEGEVKALKLSQELEKSMDEQENLTSNYHVNLTHTEAKVTELIKENEKLKTCLAAYQKN